MEDRCVQYFSKDNSAQCKDCAGYKFECKTGMYISIRPYEKKDLYNKLDRQEMFFNKEEKEALNLISGMELEDILEE